jgi:Spy/CpxP family protein refolding chaperone
VIRFLTAAIALTLALPLAAAAQTAPAPAAPAAGAPAAAPRPHARVHYMAALHSLGLTADQQSQIRGFVSATKTANAGADAATRRANLKAMRREIAGVLTPDQRTQLRATLKQQRTQQQTGTPQP